MRKLATYRQNSVSEIDKLRIKELQKQYYRMWYGVFSPLVIMAVTAGIGMFWVYQFIKPIPFSLIIIWFFIAMLVEALPLMPVIICAFDEVDATRRLLQKPGYKDALIIMGDVHPVVARLLWRMLPTRDNSTV